MSNKHFIKIVLQKKMLFLALLDDDLKAQLIFFSCHFNVSYIKKL